jgi:hypothetical protein
MEYAMNILRPQDIYVLLALAAGHDEGWTYEQVGQELGLSASQVFRSLTRAETSHLFDKETRHVRILELLEFLTHGVRYAFAAVPGRVQRGVPTAWRGPGLEELMSIHAEEHFVWPAPNGTMRGQTIEPLHPGVLVAIEDNEILYQLLALTDILRIGSARERKAAADELTRLLR